MPKAQHNDPRHVLEQIAMSIKKLVLDLENREMEGRPITGIEIQTIASQLHGHVEDLLAASRSLRDEKSGR